jgi:hypothetical protein
MKRLVIYILIINVWQMFSQRIPAVEIAADTTSIRIGEQVKLSVKAQADTLSFVDFPEMSEWGKLEVVNSAAVDTLQAKPYRKLLKKYFVTAWDSGDYVLPSLSVKINDSVIKTDSLHIKVLPVAVDTTQQGLYDFKAPVDVSGDDASAIHHSKWSWLWWLLLPVLAALGYVLYRRRKAGFEARKKQLTPYEKAIRSLEKLQQKKLWLKDQTDLHYLTLTDTLKAYLEDELGISAREKISTELLTELQKYRFENGTYFLPELLERLQEMFRRADLAKFAKLNPDSKAIQADSALIEDVINNAHEIVQSIADAKAEEEAEKQAKKRRKKQVVWGISAAVLLLAALAGGTAYYYLNKMQLTKNLKENIASPEWVYSEYGSAPALGLTTPHILHYYDTSAIMDSLSGNEQIKKIIDEVVFYTDVNPVKKYLIFAGGIDFKQEIPEGDKISEGVITGILMQIKAREINMQQADIEGGKRFFGDFVVDLDMIGKNVKVDFDSRFYKHKSGIKFVIGFYLKGNNANQQLIARVLNSAELVE